MATIQDVAKAANVSISTVSRVVNGKSNVSSDKRERVLEAIKQTGYTAPARVDSTPVPGIFTSDGIILVLSNMIHKELFSSLQENAREYGYDTLFLLTEPDKLSSMTMTTLQQLMQSGLLRGIAFINPMSNHREICDLPVFQNLPVVQINSQIPGSGFSFVGNDDHQAAFDITSFLLKRYSRITYLSAFTKKNQEGVIMSFGQSRERGFVDAMEAAGFEEDDLTILYPRNTFHSGRKIVLDLLDGEGGQGKEQLPEAFLCCSDYIALGVIAELERHGLHVPDDVGVACISGENEFPDILHPSLTRIRQSFDDIGHAAVQVLHGLITGSFSAQRSILISYQLVPGETTKN